MPALLTTSSFGVAPCLPSSSTLHLESLHAYPPHHLFILSRSMPALLVTSSCGVHACPPHHIFIWSRSMPVLIITSSFGVAPCLPSS